MAALSHFDSINSVVNQHSPDAKKQEDVETRINRSMAHLTDEARVSYRGKTFKKGNLLLIMDHLLQRSEDLVTEIDFGDDLVLKTEQVFDVVKHMSGLVSPKDGKKNRMISTNKDSFSPQINRIFGKNKQKASPANKNASKKNAVVLGTLFNSKESSNNNASLPTLKRKLGSIDQNSHTFFIRNRNLRLGVSGHNKTIIGVDQY